MGRKLGVNKVTAGFSIVIELQNELDEYCNSRMTNKSRLISNLIREFLEKNKNKKLMDV